MSTRLSLIFLSKEADPLFQARRAAVFSQYIEPQQHNNSAAWHLIMSQDIPASSKRHQLDRLPVEIIRQIAASGPYPSALSLLQVNRTMRDACKDWTVFRGIIENNAKSVLWKPIGQMGTTTDGNAS
jgi:hypothetical protein